MKTWFTSDHHFGHKNIIGLCGRPFADIDEMHEQMVERWNAVVTDDDVVYVLGDFSLNIKAVEEFGPRLLGIKALVMGNHDPIFKKPNLLARYEAVDFGVWDSTWIQQVYPFGVEVPSVDLCHFPFSGDSRDSGDRFSDERPVDRGQWLLHGHVHEKWKVNGHQINVGVDVWNFTPVSAEQILEIINARGDDDRERSPCVKELCVNAAVLTSGLCLDCFGAQKWEEGYNQAMLEGYSQAVHEHAAEIGLLP